MPLIRNAEGFGRVKILTVPRQVTALGQKTLFLSKSYETERLGRSVLPLTAAILSPEIAIRKPKVRSPEFRFAGSDWRLKGPSFGLTGPS